MPSTTPIDRRTVLKGAAWAAPVIVLTTAAPAAATSPPPAPYAGPAFVVIGAGTGATSTTKIYEPGAGPLRGPGDLAPGVRFGCIGAGISSQTAVVTFTPKTPTSTPPSATSVFQGFGGMTVSAPTAAGAGFTYSIGVGPTSTDPRLSYAHVASFTIRSAAANIGTYRVVGAGGRVGEFRIDAFTGAGAATLSLQPTY